MTDRNEPRPVFSSAAVKARKLALTAFSAVLDSLPSAGNYDTTPQTRTPTADNGWMAYLPDRRITVGGVPVDIRSFDEAVELIASRPLTRTGPPLAVASINLDHVHHFGTGSHWRRAMSGSHPVVEWLNLIDGVPIAVRARLLTHMDTPRLAGSDLIGPVLDRAERSGASVGFLGGSPQTHARLRDDLRKARPALRISGLWSPSREELADPDACTRMSKEIAAANTDILIVALGKPRQELWIAEYGPASQARVLLAFGAVVDFLAGRVRRAPRWVARAGLEWAWRLALEPRRLAHRYLVEGPVALARVMTTPRVEPAPPRAPHGVNTATGRDR